MPIIAWLNEYSIGIKEIDEQHQKLFKIFNKTYDALIGLKEVISKEAILDELTQYTLYHFKAEEDLMRKNNHPGLDHQIREHQFFVGRLNEIRQGMLNNRPNNSQELVGFLCDWLVRHITIEDKKIGSCIK